MINKNYRITWGFYGGLTVLFSLFTINEFVLVLYFTFSSRVRDLNLAFECVVGGSICGFIAFMLGRRWRYWHRLAQEHNPLEAPSRWNRVWIIGGVLLVILGLLAILPPLSRYHGSIRQIESLNHPIAVKGWVTNGLFLADGRTVPLPGLESRPLQSAALTNATERGVELASDGRIYGLVKIHHWCGNDPVREHLARVDISDMLFYVREGEILSSETNSGFSQWGWNVSQFYAFESWQKHKERPADQIR